MTLAEGANLRAGSAGITTRTFFLTEGRRRLTDGSSELLGLALGPAPDCGGRRSRRRRSLARATVTIGQGEKTSMSTSSSDDVGIVGAGMQNVFAGSAVGGFSACSMGRRGSG